MAMTVKEVREWLNTLPDDTLIGVDAGGLTLEALSPDPEVKGLSAYLEVGGLPD